MVAKLHATSGITLTPELARPGSVNYYEQISVAARRRDHARLTGRKARTVARRLRRRAQTRYRRRARQHPDSALAPTYDNSKPRRGAERNACVAHASIADRAGQAECLQRAAVVSERPAAGGATTHTGNNKFGYFLARP